MSTLISYYSRTGLTKHVAKLIAKKLKDADIDRIHDKKDRSGADGYLIAGKDAALKQVTAIEYLLNPVSYDVVIIGGPVWAFTLTPAVRTFILNNLECLKTKKVLFFATQTSNGAEGKFKAMKGLGIIPVTTMILNAKDIKNEEVLHKKIDEFVSVLEK